MEGADLTEAEASAAVAQDESVPGSGPGGADEDFSDIGATYNLPRFSRPITLLLYFFLLLFTVIIY